MRSHRILAVLAMTAVGCAAFGACSSGSEGGPSTSAQAPAPDATTATSSLETHTAAPGAVGQSPGGVTTAVGAPAESTEDEYFQACQAAKTWMTAQGGDPKIQFEPYLRERSVVGRAGAGHLRHPVVATRP